MAAPAPQYWGGPPPHQAGMVPLNAIVGPPPSGVALASTFFGDTPAPLECSHCGQPGLTEVRHSMSLAAVVGCLASFGVGICFLLPGGDCLWHKHHFCPACRQKVADFVKDDHCLVMDPPNWEKPSYAVPA
eukprot:SM000095S24973  [mRNA]  locus=s95:250575:251479:+ [translate_table: standard]